MRALEPLAGRSEDGLCPIKRPGEAKMGLCALKIKPGGLAAHRRAGKGLATPALSVIERNYRHRASNVTVTHGAGSQRTMILGAIMTRFHFFESRRAPSPPRIELSRLHRASEPDVMSSLIAEARLSRDDSVAVQDLAAALARGVRESRAHSGGVDALMLQFSLDSREGVALMCLAEALLRIPDVATRDRLIRDKIGAGDWQAHLGRSPSLFVNAAAWGLLVTGKLVDTRAESALEHALASMLRKGGEPLIRKGVDLAMRLLGKQFVTGRTIHEALANAREREARGYRFSFDMLGEGAATTADALKYLVAYEEAIHAIGAHAQGRGVIEGPGISVKLSALHPRYARTQQARVHAELIPRLLSLARLARSYDIALNVDAEETDRLELSLDLIEAMARDPQLDGWGGIGIVVQAYQKRARPMIEWLISLARETRHRFMVRLVKGAYWDTEIKRAQVDGLPDYPVFTRKAHTDVSYLACARAMLSAPDAIYPQFATHNAHTVAAISRMGASEELEYQCLHGMGESLYDQIVGNPAWGRACRIYAPVGSHETLLAYLVRRLLENGANSSFVNRIVDPSVTIEALVADPVAVALATGDRGAPNPRLPAPARLYPDRLNSPGIDFASDHALAWLEREIADPGSEPIARPLVAGSPRPDSSAAVQVLNPADHDDIVGSVIDATVDDVRAAIDCAVHEGAAWDAVPAGERASLLERAADLLERDCARLVALAVREAGKSMPNAAGEVREAIDFCRYYAAQARRELNGVRAIGPVACITPWNFPLAIFVGEVSAALAAGNPVLAKPAEQTPLMAAAAVRLFHEAGIPGPALQLLPGRGEIVGQALVADPRIRGILFTGSTNVARIINRQLAARDNDTVLIAETGGQNAMIVDSSALPEQVVQDAIASAFDSAAQRCSALRVLCVQDDIADRVFDMLEGAMRELRVGDPRRLDTDVGPVIDNDARTMVLAHIEEMRALGLAVVQAELTAECAKGTFVPPTIVEIRNIGQLQREVFGPVLHVLRFRRAELSSLVDAINATGYGLTHGIQSRIDETVDEIVSRVRAGNIYINRNIIGAVVGVQPFGGAGLSGTGPKAGGELYLRRLVRLPVPSHPHRYGHLPPALAKRLVKWVDGLFMVEPSERRRVVETIELLAQRHATDFESAELPGPTGETNRWSLRPRGTVECIAEHDDALPAQMVEALATGNRVILPDTAVGRSASKLLGLGEARNETPARRDAALVAGSPEFVRGQRVRLAAEEGAIVTIITPDAEGRYDSERLLVERVVTTNTTASGGNAELLAIAG